jgi:hypothetical protein
MMSSGHSRMPSLDDRTISERQASKVGYSTVDCWSSNNNYPCGTGCQVRMSFMNVFIKSECENIILSVLAIVDFLLDNKYSY